MYVCNQAEKLTKKIMEPFVKALICNGFVWCHFSLSRQNSFTSNRTLSPQNSIGSGAEYKPNNLTGSPDHNKTSPDPDEDEDPDAIDETVST